jgi:predicted nucleotide-binding protein (sugar kinase/HSP70/actin superfamily)
MINVESENNIKKSNKHNSKMKKLLMVGILVSTLLTSCMEKTTPLKKETNEGTETIEYYSDFHVVESETRNEIHIKNNAHVIVYANSNAGGRGLSGEVCITTEEHPEEIFSDKSFGGSNKYKIIYEK